MKNDVSAQMKLEAAFEQTPAGMAILRGPQLIFEKINSRWSELAGAKNYLNRAYEQVHPELAGGEVPRILRQVLETGVPYQASGFLARVANEWGVLEDRYYDVNFSQIKDAQGMPYGVFCHTQNVTEAKLVQVRLEESERRFQQLADSLPQIVWTADPGGHIDYFNARWYEFLGGLTPAPDSPIWEKILHPDDLSLRNQAFEKSMRTGEPYQLSYRFFDQRTGSYRWFMGRAIAARDAQGKIIKWYGSSTDIDDQKKIEQNLERAKSELHEFLMQAPIGIAILSGPNHVYHLVNPRFLELLFANRPASDFLGKTVKQALPELAGQGFFEILDEVYRTGTAFVGAKIRASMQQADGTEKELFVNFTYQAKRDSNGEIDGILAVIYEVTDEVNEQKEFEILTHNLRSAILSRDNFLGVASHELNTPLTSLKLQTQQSKRTLEKMGASAFTHEKISKVLDNTLFQADRLSRLVNDMLDVSRVTSGRLTVVKAPCDFSALVEDLLDRFQAQFEAAGCFLLKRIEPNLILDLDAPRIEQVVVNLITNAMKYAPHQPVEVALTSSPSKVCFSVKDSGPGVAKMDQHRIFGRFERATSSNEVSGLGLGLYICKQIIEEHGGSLSLESEIGHGSKFIFELPRPGEH